MEIHLFSYPKKTNSINESTIFFVSYYFRNSVFDTEEKAKSKLENKCCDKMERYLSCVSTLTKKKEYNQANQLLTHLCTLQNHRGCATKATNGEENGQIIIQKFDQNTR